MKKIIYTLLLLSFSCHLLAQQPDAEYILLSREYTNYDDGSMDIRIRKELKLLRNRAITAYALNGETFIEYNPQFESVTINECYTLLPDGNRVTPRRSAIIEQLPSHCADCGRLNNIREMAIIHTGLEKGCTVVLDYTLHRQSSRLFDHFDMMQRYPVKQYKVVVNGETWRDEHNIPQNDWSTQPYSIKPTQYEVDILFGELPQWKNERWLSIVNEQDTLTRLEPLQRAETICKWVRNNVVCHHGLDLARLDYIISPAETVYNDNCGTPADCIALAVALMNRYNLDAQLVCDTTVKNIAESFRAEVIIDKIHYRINPLSTETWTPIGAAVDESEPLIIDSTLTYHPEPLADGYNRITLPTICGAFDINPALLSPSRNIPIAVKPCEEHYLYTIKLPNKTNLIGGEQEFTYNIDGVGSVAISVKQKGRRIIVTRHLIVSCHKIDMDHYTEFRQMVQIWQTGREIFVK